LSADSFVATAARTGRETMDSEQVAAIAVIKEAVKILLLIFFLLLIIFSLGNSLGNSVSKCFLV
jgi:hypothetical protein